MKGYLNGGYFNELDLIHLASDKSTWIKDIDQLKPFMQSMKALYQNKENETWEARIKQ